MFDHITRRWIDRPLNTIGKNLASFVSANTLTGVGFFIGLGAIPALAYQHYVLALGLILTNRLLDGLDGAVARHSQTSDFGGYIDIVCDFIFYAGVVFGFALARPEFALWSALLIFGFMGTSTSFLAFAILAEKHKMETEQRGKKSFYYLGGLAEGTETILFFVAFCLFPHQFPLLACIFSLLCGITTVARIFMAKDAFTS